ncbi:MAG: helicase-related protein [Pseudomonadota bacterium]
MASDLQTRIRNVTAVLGPTNTGKTHLAIERMLGHQSGIIGLPLRLLAREVYDKVVARVGAAQVALVTGEEKIKPERARYWVSTVEAMPRELDVDFLAIDEIQLAADPERGHTFTDRLLHARGRQETLLLGAQTMREAIQDLIPEANFISRPRLSQLTYAGSKKITRLPARTAVVAFSASEVYALAELIRRQRGGAAVVLGALSPRTRNAQVELYQSGDVDYLVATDAIGMGLNLNVDHVAFAAVRKFDGHVHRALTPAELAQIGGRAGRHLNDGTFGVTGDAEPFEPEMVERLENHNFDPVKVLQWRNRRLDFGSIHALKHSLNEGPGQARLVRAREAEDVQALEAVTADAEIVRLASGPAAVAKLWEVCQVPDYRKISSSSHAEMIAALYKALLGPSERLDEDWFAKQVALSDRTDGDIDTLANRIAHIRTWTFVANRADWLKDPLHWQGRTREIEDSLSDALHECLTQRFVDKRTSALMKGMREKDQLTADIASDGTITVESHFVGKLQGFRFYPDKQGEGIHGRAQRNAAAQVLEQELAMRARRIIAAKSDAFSIARTGAVLWRGDEVGKLTPSDDPLKPTVTLIADTEYLSGPDRERIQARIETFLQGYITEKLKPLVDLAAADDVSGLAKGIAFQLVEGFGVLKRETIAEQLQTLDQPARAQLRRYGVRFGAFNIYLPMLLKPAPAELVAMLWILNRGQAAGLDVNALPDAPRAGLTSVKTNPETPEAFYRAYGFHLCGPRAVRFDILERLADLIRPLVAFRTKPDVAAQPPKGSTGDGGFVATPDMMSILGCSPLELAEVLKALGFRLERRKKVVSKAAPDAARVAATQTADDRATGDAGAQELVAEKLVSKAALEIIGALQPALASADIAAAVELSDGPVTTPSLVAEAAPSQPVADQQPGAVVAGTPIDTGTVAGAVGGVTPSVTAEATDKGAEPQDAQDADDNFDDVWRPKRHRRAENRQSRGRGNRHRSSQAGVGAEAGSAGSEADGDKDKAKTAKGRHRHGSGRSADAGQSPDRQDRLGGEGRQNAGGRRKGGKGPERSDGPPRRKDRGRDQRNQPRVHSSAPSRKKGIDPDSPFAALGALKDALKGASGKPAGDDKKP